MEGMLGASSVEGEGGGRGVWKKNGTKREGEKNRNRLIKRETFKEIKIRGNRKK